MRFPTASAESATGRRLALVPGGLIGAKPGNRHMTERRYQQRLVAMQRDCRPAQPGVMGKP
jgi:hypothetical protein